MKDCLDQHGFRYFKGAEAAMFFWLDLRHYMGYVLPVNRPGPASLAKPIASRSPEVKNEIQDDPEERLRKYFEDNAKVLLLPGQTMFNSEPGFYRLCFTAESVDKVTAAIYRMDKDVIQNLIPPSPV